MSDFIMGARLELTDDFSTTLSAATQNAQQFRNTVNNVDTGLSSMTQSVNQATQSVTPMAEALEDVADVSDGIQGASDAVQDMVRPAADAAENMNRWNTAMSSFDNGVNTIRQLPGTLRQIATTKLEGLKNSFAAARTRASELASNVRTLAQTRVSSLVSSFRTFHSTVSEGRTGIAGLLTSLKNVGKISVASVTTGLRNLVTQGRNFVGLRISRIGSAIQSLGGPAGIAKTAFSAMGTGLKKVASISLNALVTGLSKVGSVAKDAAAKIASGIGHTAVTAVKGLSTALLAAATAAGGIVAASINVGKSFEAGMSSVASISGATGDDLAALEAKAKEMGATTSFSATEAASAMEYMAMAGWKTEDMVGGIEGVMNLAAASGSDLATTSDIVTDALTAFGMTASDSGRFADVMAAASSNANTNVEMMGETFKYVGAAAGAMGYSIEDMAVATGLMANSGIKGSQAGTALRATITRMAKPTKESQAAMDALGISLTDSSGNMKDFDEIMADMRKGMSSMTEDQKASYAAMLGGQEAMSGLLAIANASDSDFDKLTEAINGSTGAAQDMANIKLDNLEGDITILKSGLEGLGIEIYEGLSGPLREVTQLATGMVSDLSAAFKEGGFEGLVGEVGTVLSTIVTKVAEYAPKVIDMAVSIVDSLLTGIEENAPAIGQGAASTVTAFVSGIVSLLPKLVLTGITLLTEFITGIIDQFPEMLSTGKDALSEFVTGIQKRLPGLISAGKELLGLLVSTLIKELPQMISNGAGMVTSFINGITEMLPGILETGLTIITTLATGLANNLPQIITAAVNLILTLAQGIITMLPTIVQAALQLILSLVQGLIANLPMIIDAAVQMITSLISGIVTMLPEIINAAIQLITSLVSGIIDNLPQIITAAIEIIFALISGLIQALPDLIAAIPQLIGAIIDTIFSTDWLEVGGNIIAGIGNGLIEGVKNIGSAIADACGGIWDGICGFFGIHSPSTLMRDTVGVNLADGISEGFTGQMDNNLSEMEAAIPSDYQTTATLETEVDTGGVTELEGLLTTSYDKSTSQLEAINTAVQTGFTSITNTVSNGLDTILTTVSTFSLYDSGVFLMEGFNNGILAMKDTLQATATSIANGVKTSVNSALDIHSPSRVMEESGEYTGEGFINGILAMIDKAKTAAQGLGNSVVDQTGLSAINTSATAVNAAGVTNNNQTSKSEVRITIEKILLEGVGEKDPTELVNEIIQALYDKLSNADEVLSNGELGALL